jgi:hypothetical protein
MFSASKTKQVAASGPYTLTKSLRFRSSASGYLSRTPSSTGSTQKLTYSTWIKRGILSVYSHFGLCAAVSGASRDAIRFTSGNAINIYFDEANNYNVNSSAIYVDSSAWYHIVVAIDTTQATASNRVILYVNNVQITLTGTQPVQNYNFTGFNVSGKEQDIGRNTSNAYYYDGYLADTYLIDGQQLTPSSFGATDATTGVWTPARYTGSYGTNGFHLTFANTTSTTTLGYDTSGNSNNWTTNNISLTSGATYDSMNDVPMLTSATASNYCVLNLASNTGTYPATLSNGNLNFVGPSGGSGASPLGTFAVSSGKWYWEITLTSSWSGGCAIGIVSTQYNPSWNADSYFWNFSYGYGYEATTGKLYTNHVATTYGATFTSGDVIGVALDLNAGTLTFYKNNVSQGTATSGLSGTFYPTVYTFSSGSGYINFGQQPFAYTPPSGYVALNTYNLPTPTILQGNKYMDATLYTGNTTGQTVTNAGGFQPDFFWLKARSAAYDNGLIDTNRGTTNYLISNSSAAESVGSTLTGTSTGFSLLTGFNNGSTTYVAWQWQAGKGSNVSNTNGSITSTVSASTTAGFSIVKYTGTGANATVGHGLGLALKMLITKRRDSTSPWVCGHTGLTSWTYAITVNATGAQYSNVGDWNSTAPTSSVFSLGNDTDVNASGGTYVAYCFAQIDGFSAFGNYTGNGSTTGPFVYTGFQPKFLLIKQSSAAGNPWVIIDATRSPYNYVNLELYPNTAGTEGNGGSTYKESFYSNGFQINQTDPTWNASGATYIYAAFASNPFKYSNAF